MPAPTGAPLERPALAQPLTGSNPSREVFLGFDSPGGIARMGRLKLRGDRTFRIEIGLDSADRGQLLFGGGLQGVPDIRMYRRVASTLAVQNPVAAAATEMDWIVGGESQPRVGVYVGTTGGEVFWGDGTGAADAALLRSAAKTIQLNDNAGGRAILDLGGFGQLTLPRNTNVESTAGRVRWTTETDATTGARLLVYDSQRERNMAPVGWSPYAHTAGYSPETNGGTLLTNLAINGQAAAIPIEVTGHMLLQSISFRVTAASGTGEFRLYVQRLNNGNAGEKTLDEVPNSAGTFAALGATGVVTGAVAAAPVYIGPGYYWLLIRNTSATTVIPFGGPATPAAGLAINTWQTSTATITALGATQDFSTAVYTKQTVPAPLVRLRGRVFGDTVAY